MHRIGNKPYICLEYAFYSLIPQKVPEKLARRLVRYYQNALRHNLTAHDKIEFEIVFSSYDFGTEQRTKRLVEYGFTEEDRINLVENLKEVTEDAVLNYEKILEEDMESLRKLEKIRGREEDLLHHDKATLHQIMQAVQSLRAGLQHYGTPQFARQAVWHLWQGRFCGV